MSKKDAHDRLLGRPPPVQTTTSTAPVETLDLTENLQRMDPVVHSSNIRFNDVQHTFK